MLLLFYWPQHCFMFPAKKDAPAKNALETTNHLSPMQEKITIIILPVNYVMLDGGASTTRIIILSVMPGQNLRAFII